MNRTILHIDMDAFFASIEQRDNPLLKGKPLMVCGDPERRSVVSTASYEARAFGVRAGMPIRTARRLCPHGTFIVGHPAKYLHACGQALRIYRAFTPIVEPFSIDEAFLDLTGTEELFGSPEAVARAIKRDIRRKLRLTCSIGIGPNKLLAKLASEMQKPDGLTHIRTEHILGFLDILPITQLWGVGEKTAPKLKALGVATVGDLRDFPLGFLKSRFGKAGQILSDMAHGRDASPVIPYNELPDDKSMSHERTFREDTDDRRLIEGTLLELSDKVARRLRQNGVRGRVIVLKLRDSTFLTITRQTTLSEPTCFEDDIYALSKRLLGELPVRRIRLVGVGVASLTRKDLSQQLSLFDPGRERRLRITEAVDHIRDRYGERAILRATLVSLR